MQAAASECCDGLLFPPEQPSISQASCQIPSDLPVIKSPRPSQATKLGKRCLASVPPPPRETVATLASALTASIGARTFSLDIMSFSCYINSEFVAPKRQCQHPIKPLPPCGGPCASSERTSTMPADDDACPCLSWRSVLLLRDQPSNGWKLVTRMSESGFMPLFCKRLACWKE